MAIAMRDFNITAEELEDSGLLRALGLTLVRLEISESTRTNGKCSCIDYALVTATFNDAIAGAEAVKTLPWGPHLGLRLKFKTDIGRIIVPEIVRSETIEKAG